MMKDQEDEFLKAIAAAIAERAQQQIKNIKKNFPFAILVHSLNIQINDRANNIILYKMYNSKLKILHFL